MPRHIDDDLRDLTAKVTLLLRRAVLTILVLPDPHARFLGGPRSPQRMKLTQEEIQAEYGIEAAIAAGDAAQELQSRRARRHRPTPADVSRCLQVLGWLTWLKRNGPDGERAFGIIWRRALGIPAWKVAAQIGVDRSDDTIRRWEAAGVQAIAERFRAEIEAVA